MPEPDGPPPVKRSWNPALWAGFLLTVAAFLSYVLVFYRYPITRDVPWVNWILFAAAMLLLVGGLRRAFGNHNSIVGKSSVRYSLH